MTTNTVTDQVSAEAFPGKVLSDTSGLTTTIMASIGDRLGLFRNLAESPATSTELAQRTHTDERYVREWLCAMTSAGYITYDPASSRFALPAAHIPVLVQENGPMFLRCVWSVNRTRQNAGATGWSDRANTFPTIGRFAGDSRTVIITTFDVIHDSAKPRELLRSIRAALQPDGRYVCLEINAAETLEQNAGPLGSFLYGFSVLYCMTSSLAKHGEGLGTMGMPESKVRALCTEAGFSKVQRIPMENPFNSLYEVTL